MKSIGGWLLVYLGGSALVTLFYAAGLAGRFVDYHPVAVVGFFFVLAVPLVLIVLNVRSAPAWNIAALWVGAGSISLILLVAGFSTDAARLREAAATIVLIACDSIAWAAIWTMYFLRSDRVANTFTNIVGSEDCASRTGKPEP